MSVTLKDPGRDAFPTVFADWLELKAMQSLSKTVRLAEIRQLLSGEIDPLEQSLDPSEFSGVIDYNDLPTENIEEVDEELDFLLDEVAEEFSRRKLALNEAYPYEVIDGGYSLSLANELNFASHVYLFCLIVSNHYASGLIETKNGGSRLTDHERDLFQICASIGAAGLNSGPVVSIGFPRPDRSPFLEKMKSSHAHLAPIIIVRERPVVGAPADVKDGGIDVLSWTPEADGRGGMRYYMGQAASGHDWHEKSAVVEIGAFKDLWFEKPPVEPLPQMFIPFCVTGSFNANENFQTCVEQAIHTQSARLGFLVHRHRLPLYVHKALQLTATITSKVERYGEQEKIKTWVADFMSRAAA